MKKLQAVIGANFGDEGKGVITDYLARPDTLVVRFNGGAQASHHVTLPSGHVHGFRHIGAGTCMGAATLLSSDFICNPIAFLDERRVIDLRSYGWPHIYIDTHAMISTPFDMMLNQAVEAKRGIRRHGSCGMGINETVTRCKATAHYRIGINMPMKELKDRLYDIRDHYVPLRLTELNLTPEDLPEAFLKDMLIDRFIDDIAVFFSYIKPVDQSEVLNSFEHVVFEGAQGLGLDELHGEYPYVTRSRTGMTNILKLLDQAGIKDEITTYYVTRAYFTRHGNGPLANSSVHHPYNWTGPEANVYNTHQGTLRYAPWNLTEMRERIVKDVFADGQSERITPLTAMTCLDQVPSEMSLGLRVYNDFALESWGPTRTTVKEHG